MRNETAPPVVVLGALNLDLCGASSGPLRAHDSNPGHVALSAGGVGHNIARRLSLDGVPVELAALLGNDSIAQLLRLACAEANIGLRHAVACPMPSSAYLCVHDERGEMAVAVNDMRLLDAFTPARLRALLPAIGGAPLAAADANLPQETLELLAKEAGVPLFLDPVSGFKAPRARRVLHHFTAIKPNLLEAEALTGESTPQAAAASLLSLGVRQAYISLGEQGLYYADAIGDTGHIPAATVRARSYNGAGDAMSAGIVRGMLLGMPTSECARMGMDTVIHHLTQQGGASL